jgi:redox-sensitive bicupin YhaK (pirin superfamily)
LHPHRGFETVTYMIDGNFQHQDSNGGGLLTDGDTQWMTAGAELSFCQREWCR